MDTKNCELRFLNRDHLAEQGIDVPPNQPYCFNEASHPNVGSEMRNGLDAKSERGSPVFTVRNVYEEEREGDSLTVIELEFNRIDPTPYSKVPHE